MAEKKVTIKDVAREAGVSISTVSRFLNHKFSSMSAETKERIEEVIDALHYHPNKLAQGLKGQSHTVAILVVNMSYPYCVSVTRSLSKALYASGYSLLVCESGSEAEKELTLLRSLVAQGVDAIILQTNGHNNELLEELAATMPIVLIDRNFSLSGTDIVVTNNEAASRELTEALFAEGYEEILFVSEPLEGLSTRVERYNGYVRACTEKGKQPRIFWVHRDDLAGIQAVAAKIAGQKTRPFAVYTSNGLLMIELYPLLKALSHQVPTTMGLATFDEPDWTKITTPMLTCVRQPTTEIGLFAAGIVLERLRGDSTAEWQPSVQVIPSQVVFGAATQLR